jgi:hypothetical protein
MLDILEVCASVYDYSIILAKWNTESPLIRGSLKPPSSAAGTLPSVDFLKELSDNYLDNTVL